MLTKKAPARYLVVGIATWAGQSSPLGASITAFTEPTAARVLGQPGKVDAIDVESLPGLSQQQVVQRIQNALHDPSLEVVTGQAVTAEGQNAVHQALSLFDTVLLAFAVISLFVGSFLILNTFSILVAERNRELALLRAVGASRRQVTASVLAESVVVGLVASALGLLAGVALALALRAGLNAAGVAIPANGLVLEGRTALVAIGVGTLITVIAAVNPARRAARTPPVALLSNAVDETSLSRSRRLVAGLATVLAGAVVVVVGLTAGVPNPLVVVGGGCAAVFVGLAMLGPFVAKPLAGAIGSLFSRRGVTGELARQNAMRNPTRTSATAAALMVGVALVSVMSIVAASEKASIDASLDSALRASYVVSSGAQTGAGSGLSPQVETALRRLPEVASVAGVRGGLAEVYGQEVPIAATDPVQAVKLFDVGVTKGDVATMTVDGIAVSTTVAGDHHLHLGSVLTVTFPTTGAQRYRVEALYTARELAGDYVLTLPAAVANFSNQLDLQVYVGLKPGANATAARSAITAVLKAYPSATLMDETQYKANINSQIDGALNLVYALLLFALIIALLGIANTLALSVHERIREIGLLRAVGMTRTQLRASMRFEAMTVSLLGALEGLIVGVVLGAGIVLAMRSHGVSQLSLPYVQLVILALVAGIAGRLAARRPAKRAAGLDVLDAINTE